MKTIFSLGVFLLFGVIFFLAGIWSQEVEGEFHKFFINFSLEFFQILHLVLCFVLVGLMVKNYPRRDVGIHNCSFWCQSARFFLFIFYASGRELSTLGYKMSGLSFEILTGVFIISAIAIFLISALLYRFLFLRK